MQLASGCAAGIVPLDFGSEGERQSFINADLTVSLGREPVGEWIGMRAEMLIGAGGTGNVHVAQFDGTGQFGHSLLSRLANPR